MSCDERPAKRRKLDFSHEFKIIVGGRDVQKTYTVQKFMLVKSSDFFKAACSDEWKEGKAHRIELPETDPTHFEIYLQLLYTGEVVAMEENLPDATDTSLTAHITFNRLFDTLARTWLLADMLLDRKSRTAIMDYMVQNIDVRQCLEPEVVNHIYQNTTPASPIRYFTKDVVACSGRTEFYNITMLEKFSSRVLAELGFGLMLCNQHKILLPRPSKRAKCYYHGHSKEEPACK